MCKPQISCTTEEKCHKNFQILSDVCRENGQKLLNSLLQFQFRERFSVLIRILNFSEYVVFVVKETYLT